MEKKEWRNREVCEEMIEGCRTTGVCGGGGWTIRCCVGGGRKWRTIKVCVGVVGGWRKCVVVGVGGRTIWWWGVQPQGCVHRMGAENPRVCVGGEPKAIVWVWRVIKVCVRVVGGGGTKGECVVVGCTTTDVGAQDGGGVEDPRVCVCVCGGGTQGYCVGVWGWRTTGVCV